MNVRVLAVLPLAPGEGGVCRKHRAAGGVDPALCGPEAGSDLSVT